MKKNKLTAIILIVLIVLTAVFAIVHLSTRQQETENAIQVVCGDETITVSLWDLSLVRVTGTIVTGKGEEREMDGMAVSVAHLLEQAGAAVNDVTVTASDEYSVSLSAEEVAADNKAWLFFEDDSFRLIVFGDTDSKRNVKNVVRITLDN